MKIVEQQWKSMKINENTLNKWTRKQPGRQAGRQTGKRMPNVYGRECWFHNEKAYSKTRDYILCASTISRLENYKAQRTRKFVELQCCTMRKGNRAPSTNRAQTRRCGCRWLGDALIFSTDMLSRCLSGITERSDWLSDRRKWWLNLCSAHAKL